MTMTFEEVDAMDNVLVFLRSKSDMYKKFKKKFPAFSGLEGFDQGIITAIFAYTCLRNQLVPMDLLAKEMMESKKTYIAWLSEHDGEIKALHHRLLLEYPDCNRLPDDSFAQGYFVMSFILYKWRTSQEYNHMRWRGV